MDLHIISPYSERKIAVAWLEVNTSAGNFIIQAGHAPTIFILSPQQPFIIRLKNGKQESIRTSNAILEVTRNNAMLLLNETTND